MKFIAGVAELQFYKIVYAGFSDVGIVRKRNEDDILILPEINLFCVADGLGGLDSGDLASKCALDSIREELVSVLDHSARKMIVSPPIGFSLLEKIFQRANTVVYEKRKEMGNNMATTLSVVSVGNEKSYVAHVGDSRVYLHRDAKLKQITHDHSLVAELIENGVITKEQAKDHPRRNVITRAVGGKKDVSPSITSFDTFPGDIILVCSDGLFSMLEDSTIEQVIQQHHSNVELMGRKLVELANDAGGKDNISVIGIKLIV